MNKQASVAGFTLVEMAIVLVIIALIAGSILGASALQETARIQRAVVEINNIQTAVNVFFMKYDALPGDFSEATDYWGDVTDDGNGDGSLFDGTASKQDLILDNEGSYMFHHMGLAEIYPLYKRPTGKFLREYGVYTPEVWPGTAVNGQNRDDSKRYDYKGNYMQIASFFVEDKTIGKLRAGAMTPFQAMRLDSKMDDGNPSLGYVLGFDSTSGPTECTTGYYLDEAGCCEYILSIEERTCRLGITLGSSRRAAR